MENYEQEGSLDSLDRMFDPAVPEAFIQKVEEYQSLIDSINPSHEKFVEIIHGLDQEWPYLGQRVDVTGYTVMPVKRSEEDQTYVVERVFVDEARVLSAGFDFFREEPSKDFPDGRRVIAYRFDFDPVEIMNTKHMENKLFMYGFSMPRDVVIGAPEESQASKFDKIHYFFPEAAQDIDCAILNVGSASEAVMALSGLTVDVKTGGDKNEHQLITEYVNSIINFDRAIPYQMDFEGECFYDHPTQPGAVIVAEASPGLVVARPIRVECIYEPEDGQVADTITARQLTFGIRIELLSQNPEEDTGKEYLIPITDKFWMHDLRSLSYLAITNMVEKA